MTDRKSVASEQDGRTDEDLVRWLIDAGRRPQLHSQPATRAENGTASESRLEALRYLEELAGKEFQSPEDVRLFVQEFSVRQLETERRGSRRRIARETLLLGLLAASFLHYYFWDVNLQIAALRSVTFVVPAPAKRVLQHSTHRIGLSRSAAVQFSRCHLSTENLRCSMLA